jgi:hypothetical protein
MRGCYFIDPVPGGNKRTVFRFDTCRVILLLRLLRHPKILFKELFLQQKTLFSLRNWEDAEGSREDTEERIHHRGTENTEVKRRN